MAYILQTLDQLPLFLRALRKQRQLTQAALAAQLGMSQQAYAQLEANPAVASVERLFRVMQALQVSIDLLPAGSEMAEQGGHDPATGACPAIPVTPTSMPTNARTNTHIPPLDPAAQARILREVW